MPPILNLKNDKQFYGEIKPAGIGNSNMLEHPAPPPNPMSNVRLTNKLQRDTATRRLTDNINDPNSKELPTIQAELKVKDTFKLKRSDEMSYSERLTEFIDDPLGISNSTPNKEVLDTEGKLQKRIIENTHDNKPIISSGGGDVVEAVSNAGSEIGNRVMDFASEKLFQLVLLLGGIYLASKVLEGAGNSVSKKTEKVITNST